MTYEQTIKFVIQAHNGQVDKNGDAYVLHPIAVSEVFVKEDLTSAKVALLHDVLEDTKVTESQLRNLFSKYIVDAVVALTKIKGESNEDYYKRVSLNSRALAVKLEDIRHNQSRLHLLKDEVIRNRLTTKYQKALEILVGIL